VLIAADNLHGLNPVISEAMDALDPAPIQALARRCEDNGADYLDINPGYLSRTKEDRMTFLVETVQQASSLPLILDSPSPRILRRGLDACNASPIISALTLEKEKLEELLPLAVESGAQLTILLLDEESFSPPTLEEKIALAVILREKAARAGMPPDKLIFDPVIPSLSWDDSFARIRETTKTVRFLSTGAMFQEPTRTMAGLSNLRSGFKRFFPVEIEVTCLKLLGGAGLDIALCDVLNVKLKEAISALLHYC